MVKYLTTFILLAFSLSAWTQAAAYGGGAGTVEDPYQIWTAEQMNTIGANSTDWNKHFKLMADIDMSAYTGTQYNIIGNSTSKFSGTFDGNGYVISNLVYNPITEMDDVGLLGYIGDSGQISNLGLESVNIAGRQHVGGIAGYNEGTVRNCHVSGTVNGTGISVGGLAGRNAGFLIDCYVNGSVCGDADVGGLAGDNTGPSILRECAGTIIRCHASASVSGMNQFSGAIGGLVGDSHDGILIDCYAAGSVSGSILAGGLIGVNNYFNTLIDCCSTGFVSGTGSSCGGLIGWSDQSATAINCFWDIETSGKTTSAGGTGKTTIQMQTLDTFTNAGWDFVGEIANGFHDDWQIQANDYPRLALSAWTLAGNGTSSNPYIIAGAADLGKVRLRPSACYQLAGNLDLTGASWSAAVVPVFNGILDGQGFVISNLTIHQPDIFHVGLFGRIGSIGQIRNLGMENTEIAGFDYVGGLAGRNNGSLIGCYATGSVSGSDAGGLAGRNSGTLVGCYVNSWISGQYTVGGMVGYNDGTLISCYAAGSATGTAQYGYVGGLVGENYYGSLTDCYAAGLVTGMNYYAGGLAGLSYNGFVTSCFWDTLTSGQTDSAAGEGKTTEEMKTLSTFIDAGWDFTNEIANGMIDYWRMCAYGVDYPRLNWESTDGDFACPDGVNTEDLDYFVSRWLMTNCTSDNNYCGLTDMDFSSSVNLADLSILAANWLKQ